MDDAQWAQRSKRIIRLTIVASLLVAVVCLGLLSSLLPKLERGLIRSRVFEQAALLDFGRPRGELKAVKINGQAGYRQRFDRGTIVYHRGKMFVMPHPVILDRSQIQARHDHSQTLRPRPRGG